ncbi:hypothetical protein [Neisseria subflava]|uniref:Uncharacterized protein n=1 Tax=Neisseria subflava TaxID=28449 RepID=A0A9X9HXM1_NEISU|nr:hypothetical protein [Neisseria subflava]UTG71487.1 hypothetical protein KCG56_09010 [Neisseria subflava]
MKLEFSAQQKHIARFCLLPACCIFLIAWWLTENKSTAFIVSLTTAFMGWTNSIILSGLNFKRTEASKGKDATAQYIEKLFEEMEVLFSDRALGEATLENILTARVSILELRLSHLKKRINLELLSTEKLAELRSNPLDFIKSPEYKQQLTNLKFDYLNNIEQKYSNWLEQA